MASNDHILTLSCPDRPGIVHAVTGVFASHGHNVLDLQQFSDPVSERFFMRVHFGPAPVHEGVDPSSTAHLEPALAKLAAEYQMDYDVRPAARKMRVLLMVSKIGHCLNDLLFRMKTGQLQIEVRPMPHQTTPPAAANTSRSPSSSPTTPSLPPSPRATTFPSSTSPSQRTPRRSRRRRSSSSSSSTASSSSSSPATCRSSRPCSAAP